MRRYDVALSFAGEDRQFAQELASELKSLGLMVFYDDDEQASLLGENLTEYLVEVYKNQASYCVPIISRHYVRKRWTRHEWRAAQARAFEEYESAYILPIRLDNSELSGLLPTIGYLPTHGRSIDEIAKVISEKVGSTAEVNRLVQQASVAMSTGRFEAASEILADERVWETTMSDPGVLRMYSDAVNFVGRRDDAIRSYKLLLGMREDNGDTHYLIAGCYFRGGRFREAIPFYDRTVQLNPSHQAARIELYSSKWFVRLSYVPFVGLVLRKLVSKFDVLKRRAVE